MGVLERRNHFEGLPEVKSAVVNRMDYEKKMLNVYKTTRKGLEKVWCDLKIKETEGRGPMDKDQREILLKEICRAKEKEADMKHKLHDANLGEVVEEEAEDDIEAEDREVMKELEAEIKEFEELAKRMEKMKV